MKPTDEQYADLLRVLDRIARDYDNLSFGLPLYKAEEFEKMRKALRIWYSQLVE